MSERHEQFLDLLRAEMDRHGLHAPTWRAELSSGRGVIGRCERHVHRETGEVTEGIIHLSRRLIDHEDDGVVIDTILHEIAHALTSPGAQAHGKEWREIARRLGAKPEACYDPGKSNIPPKWIGACPHPGCTVYVTRNRLTQKARSLFCRRHDRRIEWAENGAGETYREIRNRVSQRAGRV